jgi:hypothetical protein
MNAVGPDVPLEELLQELDSNFGLVGSFVSLNKSLINTKQSFQESVSEYGPRIGVRACQLAQAFPHLVPDLEEYKRQVFREGLRTEIKNALRSEADRFNTYSALVQRARELEAEVDPPDARRAPTTRALVAKTADIQRKTYAVKALQVSQQEETPADAVEEAVPAEVQSTEEGDAAATALENDDDDDPDMDLIIRVMRQQETERKAGRPATADTICFGCYRPGHYKADCPYRKQTTTQGHEKAGNGKPAQRRGFSAPKKTMTTPTPAKKD